MKIPVEISARHIHLSKEDCLALFKKDTLDILKPLSQPGQFAATQTVDIEGPKGILKNVRVVGPVREKTQLEITFTDGYTLGIDRPSLKVSGDLNGTTGGVKIISNEGNIVLNQGIIVAQRHLHVSEDEANSLNLKDGQNVSIKIEGSRGLVFDNVIVRVSKDYKLAFQVDTDEANASGIINGSEGEVLL